MKKLIFLLFASLVLGSILNAQDCQNPQDITNFFQMNSSENVSTTSGLISEGSGDQYIVDFTSDQFNFVNRLNFSAATTSSFYIFLTNIQFYSDDIDELIANEHIDYFHITENNVGTINIDLPCVLYTKIRIQSENGFEIFDFSFDGDGGATPSDPDEFFLEDCSDGIDNDWDGFTDCDDPECVPDLAYFHYSEPTCPSCNDGFICFNTYTFYDRPTYYVLLPDGDPVSYTPGEVTCIEGLENGDYNLMLCTEYCCIEEPVVLDNNITGEHDICFNGGFEEGTLEGWEHTTGDLAEIIALPYSDTYIDLEGNSLYALKLGDEISGNQRSNGQHDVDIIQYCFLVDQENSDFRFRYALVLEDAGHDNGMNPQFNWGFKRKNSNDFLFRERINSENGGFFDVDGDINIKYWTCERLNLSALIGEEICFEAYVRDCRVGGHFGYAFIDDICLGSEGIVFGSHISHFEPVVCEEEDTDVIVEGHGYDAYSWKISKIDGNGDFYETVEVNRAGFDASIYGLFEQYELNSNFEASCDDYHVEITLLSPGCAASESLTLNVTKTCIDYFFNYCEQNLACHAINDQTFQLQGDPSMGQNCNGCIFEWTPERYFVDPNLPLPEIRLGYYNDELQRDYNVKITTPEGCTYEKTIGIGQIRLEGYKPSDLPEDRRICGEDFVLHVIGENFDLNTSMLSNIYIEDNGLSTNYSPLDINQINNELIEVRIEIDYGDILTNDDLVAYVDVINTGDFCTTSCTYTEFIESNELEFSVWEQPWEFWIPLAFEPDGDGVNDFFHPFLTGPVEGDCVTTSSFPSLYNLGLGTSVYNAKFHIYDRWGGQLIYSDESSLPLSNLTGLNGHEMQWDGTHNGLPAQPGVYVWVYEIRDCSTTSLCQEDRCDPQINPLGCLTNFYHEQNDPSLKVLSGDVTLVR